MPASKYGKKKPAKKNASKKKTARKLLGSGMAGRAADAAARRKKMLDNI